MNNNKQTQRALLAHCKGVFSETAWLDVGTEDDPCPYVSKAPDRDSYKGKQFAIAATKTGKTPSSYFDPEHKFLAEGLEYVDRWPYAEQQPDKFKGFDSSDFSKRDEFTLAIRTEQHREQIKHEKLAAAKAAAARGAKAPAGAASLEAQPKPPAKKAPLLFDVVFSQPAFCPKVKYDTCNPTALSRDRNLGPLKTTTSIVHAPPHSGFAALQATPRQPTAAAQQPSS